MSEFSGGETLQEPILYRRKFFKRLSDQKAARLPAASEDKRRAAKPMAIAKIQPQGEAGKRTAR